MFQLVMKVSFSIVSIARLATSCLEWWNMLVFVTGVLAFIADGLFGLLQKEYLRAFQLPMIRNKYIFCESDKKCLYHEKKTTENNSFTLLPLQIALFLPFWPLWKAVFEERRLL